MGMGDEAMTGEGKGGREDEGCKTKFWEEEGQEGEEWGGQGNLAPTVISKSQRLCGPLHNIVTDIADFEPCSIRQSALLCPKNNFRSKCMEISKAVNFRKAYDYRSPKYNVLICLNACKAWKAWLVTVDSLTNGTIRH